MRKPTLPLLPLPATAEGAASTDRPSAAEVDWALQAAWHCADTGRLADAARQARLAVTAALVAGAPALSDRQRATLDLLEGSALLRRGQHDAGLARLGLALGWYSPPESLHAPARAPNRAKQSPLAARETPPWACAALGRALGEMGDPARGLAWLAFATALAEQQGLAALRLQTQGDQGQLLALLDQHLPAVHILQQAVSLATKTAPREVQAGLLNQLAASCLAQAHDCLARGQPTLADDAARQAAACAERALAAAQTGHVSHARPAALCHRAEARLMQLQPGLAEADLRNAAADPGATPSTRIELLRVHARLQWLQGQTDAARALIDQALALCADAQELAPRRRLVNTRLALEAAAGTPASSAWWGLQQQALAELSHQRRQDAAARCAQALGAADLATSGLPRDPKRGPVPPAQASRSP